MSEIVELSSIEDIFEVRDIIGRGRSCVVKAANFKDNPDAPEIALKRINPQDWGSGDHKGTKDLELFLRKFESWEKLNGSDYYPEIFGAYSVPGSEGVLYYVATKRINGKTLAQTIEEKRTYSPDEARHIILEVAKGLKEIHDLGFVHRDISANNIMIDEEGNLQIPDIGHLKTIDKEKKFSSTFVHTPGYTAPEVPKGIYSEQKDMFGRACLWAELVSGMPAMERIQASAAPTLTYKMQDSDDNELFKQMIQIDPDDRPKHIDNVIEYIESRSTRSALAQKEAEFIWLDTPDSNKPGIKWIDAKYRNNPFAGAVFFGKGYSNFNPLSIPFLLISVGLIAYAFTLTTDASRASISFVLGGILCLFSTAVGTRAFGKGELNKNLNNSDELKRLMPDKFDKSVFKTFTQEENVQGKNALLYQYVVNRYQDMKDEELTDIVKGYIDVAIAICSYSAAHGDIKRAEYLMQKYKIERSDVDQPKHLNHISDPDALDRISTFYHLVSEKNVVNSMIAKRFLDLGHLERAKWAFINLNDEEGQKSVASKYVQQGKLEEAKDIYADVGCRNGLLMVSRLLDKCRVK